MTPTVNRVPFSEMKKTVGEMLEIKHSVLNVLYILGLQPPLLCVIKIRCN